MLPVRSRERAGGQKPPLFVWPSGCVHMVPDAPLAIAGQASGSWKAAMPASRRWSLGRSPAAFSPLASRHWRVEPQVEALARRAAGTSLRYGAAATGFT